MEAKKHEAYTNERTWLNDTLNWIDVESKKLEIDDTQLLKEISDLKKEVSTALDERLLLKLQMQQAVAIDRDKLDNISQSPYFGRIDFKEKFQDELETIYIGKFGLYDSAKGNMLVLDWRAPMASIYYSGLDEEVTYRTPKGMVEGRTHLKRRYVIEERKLKEIYDQKSLQDNLKDSITENSDFLIEALNKTTSGRLKEIVATIQDQQNQIIRSDAILPLVVQGVAGSGKTTIALHRMAYIIYNRMQDKEASYMVVAPNKLFLNYIEDILPDLGVDEVYQTTFEGWALKQLPKGIKLISEVDKLNDLLSMAKEDAYIVSLAAKLRGSMVFKKIIDRYLLHLEHTIIPKEDLMYEDVILFRYADIQNIFLESNQHLPLDKRIKLLGEYLKKRFKDKQDTIKSAIELVYKKKIQHLKEGQSNLEAIRPQIIALYDERDCEIKQVSKWITTFVKNYIASLQIPKSKAFYENIWDDTERLAYLLRNQVKENDFHTVANIIKQQRETQIMETEDLGPLLYIQLKLYGLKENKKYAHIIVDEAQDLDEMKIVVLRQISMNDAFTFVGDLSQGIYDYKGITNWDRMMRRVFDDKKYHYYEMTTSYRSTIEIIDFANKVISKCQDFKPAMAQPVLRHGQLPEAFTCRTENERIQSILEKINQLMNEGMCSISILTETRSQAEALYKILKNAGIELALIGSESSKYDGSVSIMPGYLSKGLEFDAVIIYDAKDLKDGESIDVKLMYVMVTRALHRLVMYSLSPTEISKENVF